MILMYFQPHHDNEQWDINMDRVVHMCSAVQLTESKCVKDKRIRENHVMRTKKKTNK